MQEREFHRSSLEICATAPGDESRRFSLLARDKGQPRFVSFHQAADGTPSSFALNQSAARSRKNAVSGHESFQHRSDQFRRMSRRLTFLARKQLGVCFKVSMYLGWQLYCLRQSPHASKLPNGSRVTSILHSSLFDSN